MALPMLIATSCRSSEATSSAQADLPEYVPQDYAWTHRPVLVFARESHSPALGQQRRELAKNLSAIRERHMVVVEITGQQVTLDGKPQRANGDVLRDTYQVDPDNAFTVLLIGKDTGVKLRKDEPVSADALFSLIDTMPMRQREIRNAEQ